MAPTPTNALLLEQLATSLARLEQQLRAQAKAAQDVAMLAADAEQIAFQARKLVTLRGRDPTEAVATLCDMLAGFLAQAFALTAAAREVATINEVTSDKLAGHCDRLKEIARGGGGDDLRTALRTELVQMANTIASVGVGQQASEQLGERIGALASSAAELSTCTERLRSRSSWVTDVAIDLSRGLRGF